MFLEVILWTFAIYGFTMFFEEFLIDFFTVIFFMSNKIATFFKKLIAKSVK